MTMPTYDVPTGTPVAPTAGRVILAPLPPAPFDPAQPQGQRVRDAAIYDHVTPDGVVERVVIDPAHAGLVELRERSTAGVIGRRYVVAPEIAIVARLGAPTPEPSPAPAPPPKPKRTPPATESNTQAAARAAAEAAALEALAAAAKGSET